MYISSLMESKLKTLMLSLAVIFIIQTSPLNTSYSKSIIKRLPGYSGDLPFKLETGYVGIGEKKDVQLFYYFTESARNPKEDPLIFYIPGGPGTSGFYPFTYEIGPVQLSWDDGLNNITLTLNPNTWIKMANIIFVDILAGCGFSYAETKEGWIGGDSVIATQANDFIRKFLMDHPKFMRNPLYIAGISYIGIVVPKITLDIYEGNERGDQPTINIQGYILMSPLTDKVKDFNSRFEYAHRMALISDDIYKLAVSNCDGDYVNVDFANSICKNSIQSYVDCTRHINLENILEPFCDEDDPTLVCQDNTEKALTTWANTPIVQQALKVRQGKIEKWELNNMSMHYQQGKSDTFCYSYDIFSSFSFHKKLSGKNCRALIISGDHDMIFPYVGVEDWIASLHMRIQVPWKPFYVNGQVGGYETKYAQNDYSLTFSTIKGAGHYIPHDKPQEQFQLTQRWFLVQTYPWDT